MRIVADGDLLLIALHHGVALPIAAQLLENQEYPRNRAGCTAIVFDVGRMLAVIVAAACSMRTRSALGLGTSVLLALLLGAYWLIGFALLRDRAVNGDYGIGFVVVGPTSVPFGEHLWLPVCAQIVLAAVSTPVALRLLASPRNSMTWPFLIVFAVNVTLLVTTALGMWLLWHAKLDVREYWENPSFHEGRR